MELDPVAGHEQAGVRLCLAVSDPAVVNHLRFPWVALVPLTGTLGLGALYPIIEPGESGLRQRSSALVDRIRSLDKRRVRRVVGALSADDLAAVDHGLRLFLGLLGPGAA